MLTAFPVDGSQQSRRRIDYVEGHLQFVFKHSGLCLAQSDSAATGGPVVQQACSSGATAQWKLSGSMLRNRASGACLDAPDSVTDHGTELLAASCNGANNQRWSLNMAGN